MALENKYDLSQSIIITESYHRPQTLNFGLYSDNPTSLRHCSYKAEESIQLLNDICRSATMVSKATNANFSSEV